MNPKLLCVQIFRNFLRFFLFYLIKEKSGCIQKNNSQIKFSCINSYVFKLRIIRSWLHTITIDINFFYYFTWVFPINRHRHRQTIFFPFFSHFVFISWCKLFIFCMEHIPRVQHISLVCVFNFWFWLLLHLIFAITFDLFFSLLKRKKLGMSNLY